MNLKINKEFKELIPPLSKDEYATLEKSILSDGCRDALLVWDEVIVDGHNRYEICQNHGIEFSTKDVEFESVDDAKIWMIDNQKGRRNLSDWVKHELAQTKAEILREKGREKQGIRTDLLSTIDKKLPKDKSHNTRQEVAKDLGWSTGKVAMADKVRKHIEETEDKELKEKLRNNEVSINQAYQDIRKEKKKEEKKIRFIERKNSFDKEINEKTSHAACFHGSCLTYIKNHFDKKIDLLLTDPPYAMDYKSGWNDWDKIQGDKREDTGHILNECFSLTKEKMKDDAHVYVFGNPNEIEVVKPIFQKYFNLKNILIWDRSTIGMGDLSTYGRSYDVIYFGYNNTWKDLNGVRDRDVLKYNRVSPNELIHPTEKPDDILQFLIKKSSNEKDVVFDPFAGSCSTLRNAHKLNRNAYGSELELKYIPEWMLTKI